MTETEWRTRLTEAQQKLAPYAHTLTHPALRPMRQELGTLIHEGAQKGWMQ